jgi:hypothetical protein
MSDNWIVENLEKALEFWAEKLGLIWELLTVPLSSFRGGGIWTAIEHIHGTLRAIGLALLVLFFLVGVIKSCGGISELKSPVVAVKLLVRFIIAKILITHGLELMTMLYTIVQGIINSIMNSSGFSGGTAAALPPEMVSGIESLGFLASIPLWLVALLSRLVIMVLSFILILTVYGRFFKLFVYTAIAPVALASFGGEPTQGIGISFLKSYAAVLLEGAVIVITCIVFTLFAASPPTVDVDAGIVSQVWTYIGELVFNMLLLVGMVKMADRFTREIFGL